jgi:hypothetical protein
MFVRFAGTSMIQRKGIPPLVSLLERHSRIFPMIGSVLNAAWEKNNLRRQNRKCLNAGKSWIRGAMSCSAKR